MSHHHHHHHHRPPPRLFWIELTRLLHELVELIEGLIPGPPASGQITFWEGAAEMGEISVGLAQGPVAASVSYLDAEGNATTPIDVPVWASDNDAAATVTAADDGLTATVDLVADGVANITASTTDADGTVVTASGAVTITPNAAASGDIEFTAAS